MSHPRVLTLYSKDGCHLCDDLKRVAERAATAAGARLEVVDITQDPELLARYRDEIPVLLLDGQEIARHRATVDEVRAAFDNRRPTELIWP